MTSKFRLQFSKLYEPWEAYLRTRYPADREMLEKIKSFWKEQQSKCEKLDISFEDLRNLLHLRNIVSHAPSFLEIRPPALQKLKIVVNNFCKKAIDIATPEKDIYMANPNSCVQEVIEVMAKKLYTHVPVVSKNKFLGVFSENTVLKLIAQGKYRPDLKMKGIKELLRERVGTDDYIFLTPDTDFYTINNLFQSYIEKRKRLGVIFLSKSGKETGDIEGLITAWDLHKGLS